MNQTSIRFGGCEVDGVYCFELTGGSLALDFVNTLDERLTTPNELLTSYPRLIQWSAQSGALSDETASRLLRYAEREPRKASRALGTARNLRDLIFSILVSLDRDDIPETVSIDSLNRWIVRASNRRTLSYKDDCLSWTYNEDPDDLKAMLWPVIDSAAHALSDQAIASRIKLCEGETCAWAFLDTSRQRNRRWCDMSVCGNRAKATRHRRRVKGDIAKP